MQCELTVLITAIDFSDSQLEHCTLVVVVGGVGKPTETGCTIKIKKKKTWKVIGQTFCLSDSRWTCQIVYRQLNQVAAPQGFLLVQGVTIDAHHHLITSCDVAWCGDETFAITSWD